MSFLNLGQKDLDDAEKETKVGNFSEVSKIFHEHLGDCIEFEKDMEKLSEEYDNFKFALSNGKNIIDEITHRSDWKTEETTKAILRLIKDVKHKEAGLENAVNLLKLYLKKKEE